jgi:hypothetical protein
METGMRNLGSGGEAKASPADEVDTDPIGPAGDENVDQTGRGGTMDAAMGANTDPTLPRGASTPRVGAGQTAAYGETIENAPAPSAGEGER